MKKDGQINRTKNRTKKSDKIGTKEIGQKTRTRKFGQESEKKVDKNRIINRKIKSDKKSDK